MRQYLSIVLVTLFFVLAPDALAQEPESLEELISSLYSASIQVVGLAAFLMFLFAGMVRMGIIPQTKPEDSTAIMWDAAIGTVLLLSSVIILNSINPDTTSQKPVFRDGRLGIQKNVGGRIGDIFIIQ
jgi:phosphatidylglycerophosphatase A